MLVCVNKWDLNPEKCERIEASALAMMLIIEYMNVLTAGECASPRTHDTQRPLGGPAGGVPGGAGSRVGTQSDICYPFRPGSDSLQCSGGELDCTGWPRHATDAGSLTTGVSADKNDRFCRRSDVWIHCPECRDRQGVPGRESRGPEVRPSPQGALSLGFRPHGCESVGTAAVPRQIRGGQSPSPFDSDGIRRP